MTIADNLSLYWSKQVAIGIADEAKSFLQDQKDLTSGDDTCLENNWEEYCVQVQDEESIAWSAYMDHIESLFKGFFEELPREQQFTLWLESEDGQDWYWAEDSRASNDFEYIEAPIYFEACVEILMSELHDKATNFKSDNITNYIEYNCTEVD